MQLISYLADTLIRETEPILLELNKNKTDYMLVNKKKLAHVIKNILERFHFHPVIFHLTKC